MKRTVIVASIVAALLAAVSGGYWAGNRQRQSGASPSALPAPNGEIAGQRKLLYYRNPMGLPDTSPVPKKDSMGMDYVPVYAGDEPDETGVVKVNPARVQTLGVKTAIAEWRQLDAAVEAVGRVEINERAIAEVAPKFEGWIERLHVSASGDPVRRGQPLFSVYSPELVSAQKELSIAEALRQDTAGADAATREGAHRLAEAARERLQNWDMAATGGKVSRRLTFTSPASGIVLEKNAVEGMRFTAGMSIFRIADLSTVWVIADVYEQNLARIKVGQQAEVTIDAFPDRRFSARVAYLYPTLNAATRTTPVRLELNNRDGLLRPGMFAHIALAAENAAPRLAVPVSAVIDSGSRQVILLALGAGKFKPQPVKLGLRGKEYVEVLEGVQAGDRVVVAANFLIDAESNLKAALADFTAAGDETGGGAAQASARYRATGRLEGIDAAAGTVSVSHAPIPALNWPAMTMDFNLAAPEVIKGIAPGTPIRFEFEQRGAGDFAIIGVQADSASGAGASHGGH